MIRPMHALGPSRAWILWVVPIVGLQLIRGRELAPSQSARSWRRPAVPTIASEIDAQLTFLEGQFVAAAQAMPADKYSYAPTNGSFEGVRTFALQVKHVATANYLFFCAITGESPPPGVIVTGVANGPDSLRTKEQILKYLKESFALGHRAVATITEQNAIEPFARSPVPFIKSRMGLAAFSYAHAFDHYGQMVVFMRANGIVPPASVGQPSANPPK
jgi:uncharacterized damage-inducible protein DinB